jgi:hypothetical protein
VADKKEKTIQSPPKATHGRGYRGFTTDVSGEITASGGFSPRKAHLAVSDGTHLW